MSTNLRVKDVKVRKPHICQGCGKHIEVGETVTLSTYADQGDIWDFYECKDCREWKTNTCRRCKDIDYCIGENYFVGSIKKCKSELGAEV